MEIKYLGHIFTQGTSAQSSFQVKGEMNLKMRQIQDTSITKNIKIIYKEIFTISTGG